MRTTRRALAASIAAASVSAFGLALLFTGGTSQSSDATQVRTVNALGASQSEAESSWSPSTGPDSDDLVPRCFSYGGPYCGWVRAYWGGCDRDWGLSYGFKDPDVLCPHDPRPSPSAAASPSATPSASAKPSPSAKPSSSASPSPSATPSSARPLPAPQPSPSRLDELSPSATPNRSDELSPSATPASPAVPSPSAELSPSAVPSLPATPASPAAPSAPGELSPSAEPSPSAGSSSSF
ncbi:hypothetical protein [Kitasatospora sp. NBC_01300]|uniref:hypothetical protein n=1 Tax=Kitasatospora sp. NBC_01300 TaxID=2903574 RepID=UPI002F90809C|nr:hypothetical protein OG556_35035 [Kitasatospora sp. NBC_01300]